VWASFDGAHQVDLTTMAIDSVGHVAGGVPFLSVGIAIGGDAQGTLEQRMAIANKRRKVISESHAYH
jgi:hypothetical protein